MTAFLKKPVIPGLTRNLQKIFDTDAESKRALKMLEFSMTTFFEEARHSGLDPESAKKLMQMLKASSA